ncbi:hypothetical protein VU01_11195 [Candidatus Electrothrix marina]|uniref:Mannitol repressor n=1 Tax=Candidatus Electrothrix marina TaxID=1859130 RepID=A0A444JEM4_9BACT|nr:hypothetical protein VU01_11195 [Candidatus Electrothrix marina]
MQNNKQHFLEHPEVRLHFENIFPLIIEESDRGAILIAASQVDLALEKALKRIAPLDISSGKLKNILDYSGPLGTFSSRISIAYFFRVINKKVMEAINTLRGLRNTVAHAPKSFSLQEHQDRLTNLYNLGSGVPIGVHQWALDGLMTDTITKLLKVPDPNSPDDKKIFSEAQEVIEYISGRDDLLEMLNNKLPKWKLGLGTALMCGVIFAGADKVFSTLNSKNGDQTECD